MLKSAKFLVPALAVAIGGCVVAPQRSAGPALPPPRPDPYCAEQRQEARVADRVADRERVEARYGGRRQDYEAAAARAEADRQRAQAARAC